jgi:hypothetical protein
MSRKILAVLLAGTTLALGACTSYEDEVVEAPPPPPPPPPPPGAVAGTIAADRDGDGRVDGYYTQDGTYYPIAPPPPPPPPPPPAYPSGERG